MESRQQCNFLRFYSGSGVFGKFLEKLNDPKSADLISGVAPEMGLLVSLILPDNQSESFTVCVTWLSCSISVWTQAELPDLKIDGVDGNYDRSGTTWSSEDASISAVDQPPSVLCIVSLPQKADDNCYLHANSVPLVETKSAVPRFNKSFQRKVYQDYSCPWTTESV